MADKIVVLDKYGRIAEQGNFDELRTKDGFFSTIIPSIAEERAQQTTSEPSTKRRPKVKGVTPDDITDLTRKTGDIAVYRYYFRSIGRTSFALFFWNRGMARMVE